MIRIYSNESSLLVNHMKNLLESNGIISRIKNETMQGIGIGELGMCWPELWIRDITQQAQAEVLIKEALSKPVDEGQDWVCKNCSETNESAFHLCWSCSEVRQEN